MVASWNKIRLAKKEIVTSYSIFFWKRIVLGLWVTFENYNVDIVKIRMALLLKKVFPLPLNKNLERTLKLVSAFSNSFY